MSRGSSAYGSCDGGGGSWDDGPPGAESDYSHSRYPDPSGYGYGSGAANVGYGQHYAAAGSTAYPTTASSRYPAPLPPPPRERYSDHHAQRKRRTRSRSKSPLESHHYDRRRQRSRSRGSSAEHGRCTRSRDRRRHDRHSLDSSPSSGTSYSDREYGRKSPSARQRSVPSPPHHTAAGKRTPRRRGSEAKRQQDSSNCNSRPVRRSSLSSPLDQSPLRHRVRSITPPKSYKTRERSSSSSVSSSRSASSRSRSVSPSARSRSSTSRSRSRSQHRDRRAVEERDRASSVSRSRERSDSDSSSRGHFSGYDRKRYFRKLKEQKAKETESNTGASGSEKEKCTGVEGSSTGETCERTATAMEMSGDDESVRYGELPPVDGVNFEDLPPPPDELFSRPRRPTASVCIRNDGSFLEMFKRMQEENKRAEEAAREAAPAPEMPRKPALPFIGKRRGGRVLKTGVVKKVKAAPEAAEGLPKDAWSLYMQEVKKYRETSCEEERKTRPLVK